MRFSYVCVLAAAFVLGACSKPEQEPVTKATVTEVPPPAPVVVESFLPLKSEPLLLVKKAPKCKKGQCAEVRIESLRFPNNSVLTVLIEKELVGQSGDWLNEAASGYDGFSTSFLKSAEAGWEATLSAKLLRQTGPLVLLQLDSYSYTGGAHGMPSSTFLNFDRRTNQKLKLDDVVLDGMRPALIEKLQLAHSAWKKQEGFTTADFAETWPFVETDNFALAENGLVFGYAPYAIGPYSAGMPALTIPYAELGGILKAEWLPAAK